MTLFNSDENSTNVYEAFLSVFVATVLTMITVGVESKGHVKNEATTDVSFREGFLAVTNIIFAYRKLNSESPNDDGDQHLK